jgi:hypothetical protein
VCKVFGVEVCKQKRQCEDYGEEDGFDNFHNNLQKKIRVAISSPI